MCKLRFQEITQLFSFFSILDLCPVKRCVFMKVCPNWLTIFNIYQQKKMTWNEINHYHSTCELSSYLALDIVFANMKTAPACLSPKMTSLIQPHKIVWITCPYLSVIIWTGNKTTTCIIIRHVTSRHNDGDAIERNR